jgi:hypothetical protein
VKSFFLNIGILVGAGLVGTFLTWFVFGAFYGAASAKAALIITVLAGGPSISVSALLGAGALFFRYRKARFQ